MQFSDEQKTKINDLMTRGFSQQLAEMTVAAEQAGYSNAANVGAAVVKVLTAGESRSKVNVEAQRKKLQEQLAAVAGKPDHHSLMQSIAIKRELAALNNA